MKTMTSAGFVLEKQYSSVTPKQAQAFIEAAVKAIDPNRTTCADVVNCATANGENGNSLVHWNSDWRKVTVNGVTTTTDFTQKHYERINYSEDGWGAVVDYDTRNFEYKERGYKITVEETGDADCTEICRDFCGNYQYYRKDANGVYNLIVEFDFHSETKGTCYYYEIDTTA